MNDATQQTFDVDAFMQQNVDAPMATQLSGVPEGEYRSTVGDFDSTAFKTINTKNGPRPVLEIPFVIHDEALKAKLERQTITHRETYWLDFVEGTATLATGPDKNVRLGQLREALGQNQPPWNPMMLRNMGPLLIVIKTTSDKNDPEKKYTNIVKYAKIT